MPAMIGGGLAAPFVKEGEGWDTFVNNSWIKAINNANEEINNELLPVYVKKAVSEGNLWDNISSIDFWATDGADGIGYIASMMVPGAVLKGLGAGKYLSQLRGLKGVVSAQKADVITATVANTLFEAGAEAGNAMENFQKDMDTKLANGEISPEQYEEMKLQKARLGRDIFLSNAVILAGPNALQANMLWGKGINKTMSKLVDGGDGALAKTVVEPKLYQKVLNRGKDVLKATASEGFLEEAGQMTVENMFTNSAKKGKLTNNPFNDFNISELGDSYLDTISSTEGQKAMFLGAFLGGGMQAYSGAKTDIADRKSTQSLLDAGNNAIDAFYKTMQKDVYNEDGKINSEKVLDKVKAFGTIEQLNEIYNIAVQKQDKEALEKLRDLAATQLAYGFIMNEDLGLEVLQEHLNASSQFDEIVQREQEAGNKTTKKDIIDNVMSKAKTLEKAYRNFNDFAPTLINPTLNENQTQEDVVNFTNTLRGNYISNKANINLNEKTLNELNSKRQNILEDLGFDKNVELDLDNYSVDINQIDKAKDPYNVMYADERLKQVTEDIKEVETNLNRLKKLDRNFWNTEHIQKAFNRSTKEKKQLEKETSSEVVENNNAVLEQINNVTSSKELEDLNLDISNPIIAEKHNERLNELKTLEQVALDEELKVKEDKNKELESFSNTDKHENVNVNDEVEGHVVVDKTEDSVTFKDNVTGEEIVVNVIKDPSENDSADDGYKPDNEEQDTFDSDAKFRLPNMFNDFFKSFTEFIMSPFNKKGKEMILSLNEEGLRGNSLLANNHYKAFINGEIKTLNKDLLFQWLPLNVSIDKYTSWTGYPAMNGATYSNPTDSFIFRKNIIDAIEQGYKLEDLIVTIAGQRSPSLNTKFENNKPVKNNVLEIDSIKNQPISELELFHIDKEGQLVPVTESAVDNFSVKIKERLNTQKGAIFISIKNPLGNSVPVKLNISRVGELASPLVDIYEYILKHSQDELLLNRTLEQINNEDSKYYDEVLYNNILTKFSNEIKLLGGNESNITLEQLIETIVKSDTSNNTAIKIIQDYNSNTVLEFKEGLTYSYEDLQDKTTRDYLIDDIANNKYRNIITINYDNNKTNLDFKSKDYLEYLFNNKVLSTNLETDGYAFKQEESTVWLEPSVKIKNQKPSKPTTISKPQQIISVEQIENILNNINVKSKKIGNSLSDKNSILTMLWGLISNSSQDIKGSNVSYVNVGVSGTLLEGIYTRDNVMIALSNVLNDENKINEIQEKMERIYKFEKLEFDYENNSENIRNSEKNSVSLQENNSDSTNVEFYDTEETLTKQIQDITEQLSKTTSKVIKSALEVKLKELNEKLNTLKLQSKPEGFVNEYQKKDTVENKEVIKTKSESQVIKDVENLTRLNTMFNKTGKLPEVLQKQYDELKQEYVEEYNKLPKKC